MSQEEGGDKDGETTLQADVIATNAGYLRGTLPHKYHHFFDSLVRQATRFALSSVVANEADIYADGFAAGLEAAAVEVSGHWNVTGLRCDQKEQAERSAAVIRRLPIARSSRSARLTPADAEKIEAYRRAYWEGFNMPKNWLCRKLAEYVPREEIK